MTVREVLLKNKNNVKIGAMSAFFYCGVPNQEAIELLYAFSYTQKAKFNRDLSDIKKFLDNFDEFWKNELRAKIEQALVEKGGKITEREKNKIKDEWLQSKRISYNQSQSKLKALTDFLNDWKPIPDREVKEIYDSIDANEPDGTKIILVDGLEKGFYWTTNEYEKGMKANG